MTKVGFTCGTFDLCHAGHVLMFKECRERCDYLIVGVQSDPSIDRSSKLRPVQSLLERIIQVESVKYVDRVVVYDTEEELYIYLKVARPDIRFLGEDWKGKDYTGKNLPIVTMFTKRDHGYSSTELKRRIRGL